MRRRDFIRGIAVLGACPLCARAASAGEGVHWDYGSMNGPDHWSDLDQTYTVCSAGAQQSPIDIRDAISADVPDLAVDWKRGGRIANNGHTIQVTVPAGGTLTRGDRRYDLLQYHFHAPSEHMVEGARFPMEAHFVHKDPESGALGVLGIFLVPGARNAAFAALAAAFPVEPGGEAPVEDVDPAGLLPASLKYWSYEGSLTTPPCTEIVDWMLAMEPVQVSAGDMGRFTAIYPKNARPVSAPHPGVQLSPPLPHQETESPVLPGFRHTLHGCGRAGSTSVKRKSPPLNRSGFRSSLATA